MSIEPVVQDLGRGVYAYVQPNGSWGVNNAGILTGPDGTVLVDTCFTVARTKRLLATVAKVSSRQVRTVFNTHHHGDHTWGNFMVPGATIIGHRNCRTEMMKRGFGPKDAFPGVDWGEVELVPPSVLFDDRVDFFVGDLAVEAYALGPAHSISDVVVYIPELRVLFTGDLVFNGGTPFVVGGSVAGSLTAYDRLRQLDCKVVVPGHGPICTPAVFDEMEAYLRFVQSAARDAHAAGLTPLDAARQLDLGRFGQWRETERLAANLHRAYAELRGEPLGGDLDARTAWRDMATYSGQPLRSAA
ncbi:MAG TPA: MBL fold metallo-hydrolase [Methylomirabilota bacterium]|jgi:cyclase